jgi:hypothetical protein
LLLLVVFLQISSSCFELCGRLDCLLVFSHLFVRPFGRNVSGRSDEKCNSLSRSRAPELFTEIDYFSGQLRVNVEQHPVVEVRSPDRAAFGELWDDVDLKPLGSQYACSQALPKLGSANQKDSPPPTEFMHYCGGALHAKAFRRGPFLRTHGRPPDRNDGTVSSISLQRCRRRVGFSYTDRVSPGSCAVSAIG